MHRIDTANAVAVLPDPAAPGAAGYFSRGNPGPGGVPADATSFDNDWCNAIQEESVGIATLNGEALDKNDQAQCAKAIKRYVQGRAGGFAIDTGALNQVVVALDPPPNSYADLIGAPLRVKIAHSFDGSVIPTINVNGLGNLNVYRNLAYIATARGKIQNSDASAGGTYTFLTTDGVNFSILELSALAEMGIWSQLAVNAVPNNNTATNIFALASGSAVYQMAVNYDFQDGNFFSDMLNIGGGQVAKYGSISFGPSCPARTYDISGTNLRLALTGGPGAAARPSLTIMNS